MWLLARIFPLLVGDLVPRDSPHWHCFLKLLKICEICTSFKLTADTAAYLEILIEEHHQDFMKLYPTKSIIPKMHYMVYSPRQILNFGSLVHAWTMRHEAKLRVIKPAAKVSNFKNVCKTVAKRHQHLLCFYIHSNLLVRNIVNTGTCKPFSMHESEMLQLHLNEVFGGSNVMVVSFVTSNGFMYKQNAIILHKYDELCPIFCKIYLLLKNESENLFFVLREYETLFLIVILIVTVSNLPLHLTTSIT